jgi:hypothetical protein
VEQAVKLDVGLEIDLASALEIHIDECPALLLIKNGKGFQRLEGKICLHAHVIFCSCISGGVLLRLLEESLYMLYG